MRTSNFARRTPTYSLSHLPTCLLALALLVSAARAADDLSATLQRGLFEEEANNNLPAAIKAYEAVVNATDAQRKLAGTALFRLAECHRKLGRTNDAVALYQRVMHEYSDQTRLADLSRRYVVATAPAELGSDLGTERIRFLQHENANQQTEYARLAALYRSLTNLTRPELKRILPTAAPDPLLNTLQEQRVKAEQRLAEFPDVKSAQVSLKTIDSQIEERLDGIVAGIALKVATQKALLDQSTKALDEARAGAGTPALSQSARAEQKRLLEEEIKIVEKDLAKLEQNTEQLRNAGVISDSPSELSAKKRELLALRRQVAALADVPSGAGSTPAVSTPTDEEDKEVRSVQAMLKDSPDLINARTHSATIPGGVEIGLALLHKAAVLGQTKLAEFLLANGADVNAGTIIQGSTSPGYTPLTLAARHGRRAMVELLLAKGARVQGNSSFTPLHEAASKGFKSVVEALLDAKADVDAQDDFKRTPLHEAASRGFPGVALALIARGADVNALHDDRSSSVQLMVQNVQIHLHFEGSVLNLAVDRGDKAMVELLLTNKANPNLRSRYGLLPLHVAVFRGFQPVAAALLKAGADINAHASASTAPSLDARGWTPLHTAIQAGRFDMVQFLLEQGADPNRKHDTFGGQKGWTALHQLLADRPKDFLAMAELLFKYKADPNLTNGNSYSPIFFALRYNDEKVLELLLNNGADTNLRDREGKSPLNGQYDLPREAYELLLAHRADPNAQDNDGNTPLHRLADRAREIRANESARDSADPNSPAALAELLLARGADPNLRNLNGYTPLNTFGVPANPTTPKMTAFVSVLRKHGAKDEQLDLVADPDSIRVWRKGMTSGRVVFVRDEAGHNRFTLMEALLNFYSLRYTPQTVATRPAAQARTSRPLLPAQAGFPAPAPGSTPVVAYGGVPAPNYDPLNEFAFPDLTRIRILRLADAAKKEKKAISVNLINAAGIVLCANDVLLEFGDIIEIQEREYRLDEGRSGLTGDQNKQFSDCLQRKVQFVVKGEATDVKLLPLSTMAYLASAMKLSPVRNVLRSTSDLSRLRIARRADPATGQPARELTVDLEAFQRSSKSQWDDLWLRDGDLIEVPERE